MKSHDGSIQKSGLTPRAEPRFRKGDLLPTAALLRGDGQVGPNLRRGRGAQVLVALHDSCRDCDRYVAELAQVVDEVAEWGGSISVVSPGAAGAAGAAGATPANAGRISRLLDTEGCFADGTHFVVVADEWGEVFWASEPIRGHPGPPVQDLVDWVRFVSIQCPECEGPEGPWRTS